MESFDGLMFYVEYKVVGVEELQKLQVWQIDHDKFMVDAKLDQKIFSCPKMAMRYLIRNLCKKHKRAMTPKLRRWFLDRVMEITTTVTNEPD